MKTVKEFLRKEEVTVDCGFGDEKLSDFTDWLICEDGDVLCINYYDEKEKKALVNCFSQDGFEYENEDFDMLMGCHAVEAGDFFEKAWEYKSNSKHLGSCFPHQDGYQMVCEYPTTERSGWIAEVGSCFVEVRDWASNESDERFLCQIVDSGVFVKLPIIGEYTADTIPQMKAIVSALKIVYSSSSFFKELKCLEK